MGPSLALRNVACQLRFVDSSSYHCHCITMTLSQAWLAGSHHRTTKSGILVETGGTLPRDRASPDQDLDKDQEEEEEAKEN